LGHWAFWDCPLIVVPAEVWEAVSFARAWRDTGTPPEPGGALDQPAAFVDAARLVWSLDARWKVLMEERARKRTAQ